MKPSFVFSLSDYHTLLAVDIVEGRYINDSDLGHGHSLYSFAWYHFADDNKKGRKNTHLSIKPFPHTRRKKESTDTVLRRGKEKFRKRNWGSIEPRAYEMPCVRPPVALP